MSVDEKNNNLANEPLITSLPAVAPREQRLGLQVSVGGMAKSKLEGAAAAALRKRGEAFLEEVVLEGQRIAMLDEPRVLDPIVSPEHIRQAFSRTVNRFSQQRADRSRFWKFVHELPVVLFAVGVTKVR